MLTEQMTLLAKQAKAASRELAKLTTAEKNACLLAMATASSPLRIGCSPRATLELSKRGQSGAGVASASSPGARAIQ